MRKTAFQRKQEFVALERARQMAPMRRKWDLEETRGGIIQTVVLRLHGYKKDMPSLGITDAEFTEFLAPIFVKEPIEIARREFNVALTKTGLTRRNRVRLRKQFEKIVAEKPKISSS